MIFSKSSEIDILNEEEILKLCGDAFSNLRLEGKRILIILPDYTRSCPLDIMFRILYALLAPHTKTLDFIIALGTHPPMSKDAIYKLVGITDNEHFHTYPKARFFNHESGNPEKLMRIGTIHEDETEEISRGLLRRTVDVTINRMVSDYDMLLIVGPTFPHESMGFSGGHKYFFPGISGEDVVDTFHWIGALLTIPAVIGTADTPMRKLVDKAASMIPAERLCISLVVKGRDVYGIFIGPPEEAFTAAAGLSDKIHIVYKDHPYKRVLSCAPPMYDELWTAGKCMYKLESVVGDGGELIIYAPHLTHLSVIHGHRIEKIGFHVRDYFLKQWDSFKDYSGNILAHSCNVSGIGTYENGEEKPRINVVLATQMSEEYCKKINLGYRNPESINTDEWKDREDEGMLYVPKAGEMLYVLKDNPFR